MKTPEPYRCSIYGSICDVFVLDDAEGQPLHAHQYEHAILIASGRVVVSVEGKTELGYAAPRCLFVKAGVRHGFRAEGKAVVINMTDCSQTNKEYL